VGRGSPGAGPHLVGEFEAAERTLLGGLHIDDQTVLVEILLDVV
jgi:hypothetical protein